MERLESRPWCDSVNAAGAGVTVGWIR
jgi:hypothetical protein